MVLGEDHGLDVRVDEIRGYLELFTEDVKLAVTSYEPDEHDLPVRDVVESRRFSVGCQGYGPILSLLDKLHGRSAFQAAIPVMLVVEPLEVLALSFEHCIAWEPLSPKELTIVCVIEVFNHRIPPRLAEGDEHGGHLIEQAESGDQTDGARISIAPPETEFVIKLEKVRQSHDLPASEKI